MPKIARSGVATVLITAILVFFVGAVILGNLEPTMTDLQVTGMSTEFNDTIDDTISYGWTAFGLAILALLIIGGAYILRQVGVFG
jgi:hypothetical protein